MRFRHPALALLVLGLLGAVLAAGAAAETKEAPEATAQRIGTVCAKRAEKAATAAKRRALRQRCLKAMKRASASKRRSSADVTAPTVSWVAPGPGATVRGKISGSACEVSAGDDRGVDRVVMKVDGTTLHTESDAPWNCNFDSTKVSDGTHTLSATAYDDAGNNRTASVTITVANADQKQTSSPETAPAPDPTPAPAPEEPGSVPAPDTTAPNVSWTVPTAGSVVNGKISGSDCEALATDPSGIEKVVMKVDGTTLNTESDAPWNCNFDSTKVSDGTHTLSATAYDDAGNNRTASLSIKVSNTVETTPAPAPSPAPAPEASPAGAPGSGKLILGIDGGYGGWSEAETTYRAQLGAAVTRHEWDPAKPVNYQDALVLKAAATVHTRIHALLGGNQLGDPTHYKEWVIAFIRRYGVGGSFWAEHPELDESRYAMTTFELGNEPYFGEMSASLYAETVRPTLEAVKSLGLPAKIVLPSRVYGTDTSWMDTLYAKIPNLNELFYAFADHPYWYGHDPAAGTAAGPFGRIAVLRKRMNEKGASAKPIFITEYGESTANCGEECVSEAVQAEHLQEMLNAAITRPEWKIEMVSVFQLLDRGTGSTDRELQFGLLRQNGTPKPAYSIVRTLMQQYRG
jgi:Big-like domain-containing protein